MESDFRKQRLEPGFNVLNATLSLPVMLCRKVDYVSWVLQPVQIKYQHLTQLHLPALAGRSVARIVLRKGLPELQCDTTTHDSHAVDRVDQSLCVSM